MLMMVTLAIYKYDKYIYAYNHFFFFSFYLGLASSFMSYYIYCIYYSFSYCCGALYIKLGS